MELRENVFVVINQRRLRPQDRDGVNLAVERHRAEARLAELRLPIAVRLERLIEDDDFSGIDVGREPAPTRCDKDGGRRVAGHSYGQFLLTRVVVRQVRDVDVHARV